MGFIKDFLSRRSVMSYLLSVVNVADLTCERLIVSIFKMSRLYLASMTEQAGKFASYLCSDL